MGTISNKRERLYMISRGLDTILLRIFKIVVEILQGPVALLDLRLEISFSTSLALTGRKKKLSREGDERYLRGDIFTFGICLSKLLPTLVK